MPRSPAQSAEVSTPSPATAAPETPKDAPISVEGFESALKELESIVTRMERGELSLEDSLKLFERGMSLTQTCRQALDAAELRVRNVLEAHQDSAEDEADDADSPDEFEDDLAEDEDELS